MSGVVQGALTPGDANPSDASGLGDAPPLHPEATEEPRMDCSHFLLDSTGSSY